MNLSKVWRNPTKVLLLVGLALAFFIVSIPDNSKLECCF